MRRFIWIVGVVIVGAVLLVSLGYLMIPRERLTTSIAEQVSAWTGRDVILSGDPDIDLFPRPTVTLSNVTIGGPRAMQGAEILSVRRLVGEVRLVPLLVGDVEIGAFTLVEPHISLVRNEKGERNWDFDSGAAALQLAFAGDVPLGRFTVVDGTVDYADLSTGATERFEAVDAEIDWQSVRTPLSLRGRADWRGEAIEIQAGAENPFSFINRRPTPVRASIRSRLFDLSIDGRASGVSDPRVTGTLEATIPSLRDLLRWSGQPLADGPALGEAGIAGNADFAAGTLSVTDARISLDGNAATGALSIAFSRAIPLLSGTLAFGDLDLAPYLPDFRSAMAAGDDWRGVALDTRQFGVLATDIRLSAAGVDAGGLALGRTAATVALAASRLEIGIADAEIFGGTLAGTIAIAPAEGRISEVDTELRASSIDLAAAGAAFGREGMAGRAEIAAGLSARGATFGDLLDGMEGAVTAAATDGTIPALGISSVAAAISAGDPALVAAPATPIAFSILDARLRLAGGAAAVESARLRAEGFDAELSGTIGLGAGALDLQGIMDVSSIGAAIPFTIGGTLAQPRPGLAPIAN